jgi:hypothetical protein
MSHQIVIEETKKKKQIMMMIKASGAQHLDSKELMTLSHH